ncbi:MAG: NADH-quinone oxidoreductase subunit L [Micavibrio sp.]|nr:NADH-quinone oxidoreductase subunit L [Micavibrio sp.]|tara:strand:- start:420 stop:2687 length:2268 start_codon:yes stop_codon:yes gene_type:complete
MELLAVFLPLFAFIVAGLFGKQIGDIGCQIVTSASVIIAAVFSVILFFEVGLGDYEAYSTILTRWIDSGTFQVNWALRVDTLSVVMMCVINIVSSCVHIYSIGYMSHDAAKGRFMAYLSLFTFAMLMLVTADNLLQLFFGWEGVGLASYLLIGFWNHKPSANAAAQKAFVVNRVGDFGLALGIMAVFVIFGSLDFDVIFSQVSDFADYKFVFLGYELHALTVASLLLFMGAVGKSAQLGLHTWLPDAMEGPTPVSALIHAATMVTAGVFLVARMSPLFEFAPVALIVVTVFGATTAFVAATIGLTQFDIKRVIAYSTMSQLGYMFFALGVSAYGAAMFHLMTHAFFKALLFLGAGSVIHAMSDEQDMRNMGGIAKKIPATYTMMWIGSLALAGVGIPGIFGFAGFYSKDMVLEAAWADASWFGHYAYWMGIAAAVMTAFYSGRLIFMTFHGKPRASKQVMSHIHESPAVMLAPLYVLAFGAIFAGFLFYNSFVGSAHHGEHDAHHIAKPLASGDHHDTAMIESTTKRNAKEEIKKAAGTIKAGIETQVSNVEEKMIGHAESIAEDHSNGDLNPRAKSDNDQIDAAHTDKHTNDHDDKAHFAATKEDFWKNTIFIRAGNDTVDAAHGVDLWVKLLPLIAGLFGLGLSYIFYIVAPGLPEKCVKAFKYPHQLLFNKWYFDELYDALIVKNALRLGRVFAVAGDKNIIDRLGPDGTALASLKTGTIFGKIQSGFIYHYAFIMIISVIGLVTWFFMKAW